MNCAACPDEVARAATPPSRAAMRFSKTSTVGWEREMSERSSLGLEQEQGATYVHNTAVDVAKLLEAEEPRAVGGVIESKALHCN